MYGAVSTAKLANTTLQSLAIAIRLEVITIRVKAMASRLEAIAIRYEGSGPTKKHLRLQNGSSMCD